MNQADIHKRLEEIEREVKERWINLAASELARCYERIEHLEAELKANRFLRINDVAKMLGVTPRTVWRFIEQGDLQSGKAGGTRLVKKADVLKLIA